MKCACDVCDVIFDDTTLKTQDGHCALCSNVCFAVREIGGKRIRTKLSQKARYAIHVAAKMSGKLPVDPQGAVADARREIAETLFEAVMPFVQRGSKRLVEMVKTKVAGGDKTKIR